MKRSAADDQAVVVAVRAGDELAFMRVAEAADASPGSTVTRMLGKLEDAGDLVPVTFLLAWRARTGGAGGPNP